jgi:hypothetical protein
MDVIDPSPVLSYTHWASKKRKRQAENSEAVASSET